MSDLERWAGPIPSPGPAELADRYAVSQLVKTYALGIDMRALDLARSVFTADAFIKGALGAMPASDYLPKIYEGAASYAATQHNVTNQYVTIDGDEATVWSYAVAYHRADPTDDRGDFVIGVQYRDRCRRFPNGWLIVSRDVVQQWADGGPTMRTP